MNKVVEILEQHCQWIAIAIGGIFLAIIAWSYVLTSPVAVEVQPGQPAMTPGNVDTEVSRIARSVQDQIESTRLRPPPRESQQDPIDDFRDKMEGDVRNLVRIAGPSFNGTPFDPVFKDREELPQTRELVANFPVVPPSEVLADVGIKAARAMVIVGPVGGQPGQPVALPPPPQPGVPGAAPVLPANATDLNYVRGEYKIEPLEIQQAFADAKVPPGQTTMIVAIKVMRQEEQPDGSWSEAIEVKPLNNGIRPWPIPGPQAGFQEIGQFEAWFAGPQGQSDLLRPPFYQLISGEGPWDPPTSLDDVKAQVRAVNDADRAARQAERDAANQAQRDRVRNRPQPGAGEGERTPRGRRGDPEFKVEDTSRPNSLADLAGLQLAQVDRRRFPGGRPPLNPDDEMGMPPEDMGGMQDWAQPGQPGVGQPQMPALPAAQFDPRQSPTIYGWFFDTEVVEGKTYRYQVLYAIKNPIFNANLNDPQKPELARTFAIWSKPDDNAWSEPRTVETTTKYFIADRSWTGGSIPQSIRMEIFKWAGGKWQSRVFSVSVGDQIGWNEVGTDWGTQSRLVDVRFDDRLEKAYLLVMGPDGKIAERDPLSDRIDNNEDRAALKFLVQQAQPPAVGTGPGGVPPVAGR